jgi:putative glutamine amidotransferase
MCAKPVIAVPSDRRVLGPHPYYVVGEKYIDAIENGAAGLPWMVPATGVSADELLPKIDGLFLTGSYSNVEPHHYGGSVSRTDTEHDPSRDATTLPLIKGALTAGMPIFAVCRGFQELNVALGGTLHAHVEEQPGYHDHRENPDDLTEVQYGPSHEVNLVDGGMLQALAGTDKATVNSLHSQGVARLGAGVSVEAVADDGLLEAFQVDSAGSFALGVQWHPEWQYEQNNFSLAMFTAFGDACRKFSGQREKR